MLGRTVLSTPRDMVDEATYKYTYTITVS